MRKRKHQFSQDFMLIHSFTHSFSNILSLLRHQLTGPLLFTRTRMLHQPDYVTISIGQSGCCCQTLNLFYLLLPASVRHVCDPPSTPSTHRHHIQCPGWAHHGPLLITSRSSAPLFIHPGVSYTPHGFTNPLKIFWCHDGVWSPKPHVSHLHCTNGNKELISSHRMKSLLAELIFQSQGRGHRFKLAQTSVR